MGAKFNVDITAVDCNTGIYVEGNPDAQYEGKVTMINGGEAIKHVPAPVYEVTLEQVVADFGLRRDTSVKDFVELLKLLDKANTDSEIHKLVEGPKYRPFLADAANLGSVYTVIGNLKRNGTFGSLLNQIAEIARSFGL